MNKEELIAKAKEDLELADNNAALEGRQLVQSIKFLRKILEDLRVAKKGVKAMGRANLPTGVLAKAIKDLNELRARRTNVVAVVKARYHEACQFRNYCKDILEALEK